MSSVEPRAEKRYVIGIWRHVNGVPIVGQPFSSRAQSSFFIRHVVARQNASARAGTMLATSAIATEAATLLEKLEAYRISALRRRGVAVDEQVIGLVLLDAEHALERLAQRVLAKD